MRKHIIILLSLVIFLAGCQSKTNLKPSSSLKIPVETGTPQKKDITFYTEFLGIFSPFSSSEIQSQTEGKIEKIWIQEGEWVKKGTPLFQIDSSVFHVKRQEMEAQLLIDSAVLKSLKKKYSRYTSLAEKDLISPLEWEELEATVEKAEGQILLDQARLKEIDLKIKECYLCSPIEGIITGKISVSEGQLIHPHHPNVLARISQLHPLLIDFSLPEKDFHRLSHVKKEVPLSVKIELLCSECTTREGTIHFIDRQVDPKTGKILVRGSVENSDFSLLPGQHVKIKIPVEEEKEALLIPQKSIRYNETGPYVYVVQEDSKVAMRSIVLGREHGADQVVKEGLKEDETIVFEGHLRLFPEVEVEVLL